MSKQLTTDKQFDVLGVTFTQSYSTCWQPKDSALGMIVTLRQHQGNGRWQASCYTEASDWVTTREEALAAVLDLFRKNFQRHVDRAAAVEKQLGHITPVGEQP